MAAKHVRDIFNLPKSENIYDDFSCTYYSMPGRMYLSDNHCCFYSALLGKTVKLMLNYNSISKLMKVNSTWNKSIKIFHVSDQKRKTIVAGLESQSQEKEQSYRFYGFQDRDFSYKYIKKLWTNVSAYAKDDDESELEQDESSGENNASTFQAQDSNKNYNFSQKDESMLVEQKNGTIQALEEEQIDFNQAQIRQSRTATYDKKFDNNLLGQSEITSKINFEQNQSAIKPQNQNPKIQEVISQLGDTISKSDLENYINQFQLPPEHVQQCLLLLNLSPTAYYEQYLSESAEHSWGFFYENCLGALKVENGTWKVPEEGSEHAFYGKHTNENLKVLQYSEAFLEVQIKNNPFVKCAPTYKTLYIIEKSDSILKIRIMSRSTDVPYCDSFLVEEEIILAMPPSCKTSCVFRSSFKGIWLKQPYLKSVIASNQKNEMKTTWSLYAEYVKKNNNLFKAAKVERKLTHRVEKEDKKTEKTQKTQQQIKEQEDKIKLKQFINLCLAHLKVLKKIIKPLMIQYGPFIYIGLLFLVIIYIRSYLISIDTKISNLEKIIKFQFEQIQNLKGDQPKEDL